MNRNTVYLEVAAEGHFAVLSRVIRESDVWCSQRDETIDSVRRVVYSPVVTAKTSKRNHGIVRALQARVGPKSQSVWGTAFVCFAIKAQQVLRVFLSTVSIESVPRA